MCYVLGCIDRSQQLAEQARPFTPRYTTLFLQRPASVQDQDQDQDSAAQRAFPKPLVNRGREINDINRNKPWVNIVVALHRWTQHRAGKGSDPLGVKPTGSGWQWVTHRVCGKSAVIVM